MSAPAFLGPRRHLSCTLINGALSPEHEATCWLHWLHALQVANTLSWVVHLYLDYLSGLTGSHVLHPVALMGLHRQTPNISWI